MPRPYTSPDWANGTNRSNKNKCRECVYFTSPTKEQLCPVHLHVVDGNNNACMKGRAK